MCTLSIIARNQGGPGYRLVCSRDEQRTRPPALAPAWHDIGRDLRAAWPTDTLAGGTWIAARSDGFTLCLINLNEEGLGLPPPGRATSRGMVIPSILTAPDDRAIAGAVSRLDLDSFAPFRLVIAGPPGSPVTCRVLRWDRSTLTESTVAASALCFASSGLGDRLALPRLDLFRDCIGGAHPTAEEQDAFHAHSWPNRPGISVLMSRDDARTVSVTTVEFAPGRIPSTSMSYRDLPDLSAARATA